MTDSSARWWQEFFDEDYASHGLDSIDPAETRRTAERIIELLGLEPGARVLDQCCGTGRLSIALAELGLEVEGVDQCAPYIDRARRAASAADVSCAFHEADATHHVASRPCAAVINWFTSFGYSEDDATNRQMLERAFESLEPGGRLVLDYPDFLRVLSSFRDTVLQTSRLPDGGELLVVHENALDSEAGMLRSRWHFIHPTRGRTIRTAAIRIYLPHQLVQLAHDAGFIDATSTPHGGDENRGRTGRVLLVARRG
jgi:SAM-dependent methyltransferase